MKVIKCKNIDTIKSMCSGQILQNNENTYILICKLGSGSYASVWMCYLKNNNKLMAIKIFKNNESKSGIKEIDIYWKFSQIGIKNIINMHDKFTSGNNVCIVFDLMIGSLYDVMKKGECINNNKTFKDGFSLDFVIKVAQSVLISLNDFHNIGIIHGDVKPENILLYGKTIIHENIISKLESNITMKQILETINEFSKNIINIVSDSTDSDSESNDSTNDSCSEETTAMSFPPKKIDISCYEITDSNSSDNNFTDSEIDENNENNENNESDGIEGDESDNIEGDDSEGDESEGDESDKGDEIDEIGDNNKEDKEINNNISQFIFNNEYMENPIIKLSDLGTVVDTTLDKKPIGIQTKYYKSPELLLGLKYDESCDIWALGCTIYELITGDILFDPDDYKIDKRRGIMNQIYAKLGVIPKEMIDASPLKQIFYTDNYILKGHGDDFNKENTWTKLIENMEEDNIKKYLLIDLLLEMLNVNPLNRITAFNALKHPLFTLYQ